VPSTHSPQDGDAYYRTREKQYAKLNIRHHFDGKRYLVDCPGCAESMVLGDGWMGLRIPECPDCNDTADSWVTDPRVSPERADILADGNADIEELVRQ
jgi:hypothetical protein